MRTEAIIQEDGRNCCKCIDDFAHRNLNWSSKVGSATSETPGVSSVDRGSTESRKRPRPWRGNRSGRGAAVQAELGQQWFTRWIGADRNREHRPLRSHDWTRLSGRGERSSRVHGRTLFNNALLRTLTRYTGDTCPCLGTPIGARARPHTRTPATAASAYLCIPFSVVTRKEGWPPFLSLVRTPIGSPPLFISVVAGRGRSYSLFHNPLAGAPRWISLRYTWNVAREISILIFGVFKRMLGRKKIQFFKLNRPWTGYSRY